MDLLVLTDLFLSEDPLHPLHPAQEGGYFHPFLLLPHHPQLLPPLLILRLRGLIAPQTLLPLRQTRINTVNTRTRLFQLLLLPMTPLTQQRPIQILLFLLLYKLSNPTLRLFLLLQITLQRRYRLLQILTLHLLRHHRHLLMVLLPHNLLTLTGLQRLNHVLNFLCLLDFSHLILEDVLYLGGVVVVHGVTEEELHPVVLSLLGDDLGRTGGGAED